MIEICKISGIAGRTIVELKEDEFDNFVKYLDLINTHNMRVRLQRQGVDRKMLEKTRYKIINAWESE